MKLKTLQLLLVAMICSVVPMTTGCTAAQIQTVSKVVTDVLTLVQDAQTILATINAGAQFYFAVHPDAKLEAQYETAMGNCQAALTVAARATQGTQALTQDQIDAAFADFKMAYTALTALLQSDGIMSAPNVMSAAPGQAPLRVQTPLVMLRK